MHVVYLVCRLTLVYTCSSISLALGLAVLSGSTTGKDDTVKDILKQLLTCKEIVKEDMMVLTFEESIKVFDNPLAKLLFSTALPACVHLKGVEVVIMAVSKHPHLAWSVSLACTALLHINQ